MNLHEQIEREVRWMEGRPRLSEWLPALIGMLLVIVGVFLLSWKLGLVVVGILICGCTR